MFKKKFSTAVWLLPFAAICLSITGCATITPELVRVEPTAANQLPQAAIKKEPNLKYKVAIARFSSEAQYNKSAIFGINDSYSAEKQATDILSAKLTQSGKFILLERNDLDKIANEINRFNLKSLNIGAENLIVGSITELGRTSVSDTGVFSRSKIQTAVAKVSVRLIDVQTGQIIFAQEGRGEAVSEAGTSFGVGMHVGYDSTLNDKAISSAISSVVDGIINNLLNRPWRSYVLSVDSNSVIIAGGAQQGLRIGDIFNVYQAGKIIKNPQTGIPIELPGQKIATIKVENQFGSSYTDEGSICSIAIGTLNGINLKDVYVQK